MTVASGRSSENQEVEKVVVEKVESEHVDLTVQVVAHPKIKKYKSVVVEKVESEHVENEEIEKESNYLEATARKRPCKWSPNFKK